jgi:hypothetical protein
LAIGYFGHVEEDSIFISPSPSPSSLRPFFYLRPPFFLPSAFLWPSASGLARLGYAEQHDTANCQLLLLVAARRPG